jgi:hypothetical protein
VTWVNERALQYSFFHWPAFDPEVLMKAEETKWGVTALELLTAKAGTGPVYEGPILVGNHTVAR